MAMLDRSPLYGKRVLITRPAHSAGPSAERFRELGAEPVVVPTVAIGAPDDPSAANAAVLQIDSYAWVVFTSRNGVDAFFETLERMGGTARPFEQTKIAAIGPKTCEALEELGVKSISCRRVSSVKRSRLGCSRAPRRASAFCSTSRKKRARFYRNSCARRGALPRWSQRTRRD